MSATTSPPDAQLSVKHHVPANLADRLALGLVKSLRFFANTFFQRRYGHRAVILETIAAVPGSVLDVFPGAGHMIHHVDPARVLRAAKAMTLRPSTSRTSEMAV